jgi:katanin p60 ATPase-containing subunit A1
MLARAVATECETTFFNISASSIVSKFRGDSEKLVRVLFELARYHAPSTIFIDEIDSIMGRRDAAGEHEGSRRMKTELLIQMDGLSKSNDLVFVLAASNMPWDLDIALLRRLEKRILVPLPNERARKTMIVGHLTEGERASGLDYNDLARKTDGYSGSDIALLCKEAAMRPVRRLMKLLMTVEAADTEVSSEVKLDAVVEADVKQALACQ